MNCIVIIPARYGSTRFPGKPLAHLEGKTIIELVYRQAKQACPNVVVATDDERIFEQVKRFGGQAVITSKDHQSGTDRIAEAYRLIDSKDDIVVNVQGDEPFIQPEQILKLIACFDNPKTDIATLANPITEGFDNPNWVKVVFSKITGKALYFSRSIIPFLRSDNSKNTSKAPVYYRHLGIYAYRASVLQQITKLPVSPLEQTEKLEQLRWLENGYNIQIAITDHASIGIDTPEDLKQANDFIKKLKSSF